MAPQGLSTAAKQLASYGRGVDTELAHMSPDEMQFIDYMQGGRKENPYTGLPEYGWLGKLLKGIARVAGATVGYSMGGPLGAAAGSGIMTKATGGTWKQAAKGAAYSGLGSYAAQGLSGGGWGVTGSRMPYNVTAPDMDTAFNGSGTDGFNIEQTHGLDGIKGAAFSKAGLGAAYGALSQPLDNGGGGTTAPPPPTGGNWHLPTPKPLDRIYSPYQGDYSKYGQGSNTEHSFFSQPPLSVIPTRTDTAAPSMYGEVKPGVQYLAEGGPVGLGGGAPDAMALRQAALQGFAMGGE